MSTNKTVYLFAKYCLHSTNPTFHMMATLDHTPPKGYHPIAIKYSPTKTIALLLTLPETWLPPKPHTLRTPEAIQQTYLGDQ